MIKTSRISYGATAAVVTSTALINGLSAAGAAKSIVVSALLIAAIADNLTDSLSIHIFQESEQLEQKDAFTGTVTNFVARLLLCISFVLLILLFPPAYAANVAIFWGIALLVTLTYLVARERKAKILPEIFKHLTVACAVVMASMLIGHGIRAVLS